MHAAAAAVGPGVALVVVAAVDIDRRAMARIRGPPAAADQPEARVGVPVEPRVVPGMRQVARHDRAIAAAPAHPVRATVASEIATTAANAATATTVSVRVQGGTRPVLAAPPVAAATRDEVRTGWAAHPVVTATGPRPVTANGSGPTGVLTAPVEGMTGAPIGRPPATNGGSRAAGVTRRRAGIGGPREARPVTSAGPTGAAHRGAPSRSGTEVGPTMAGDPTRGHPGTVSAHIAAHDVMTPVRPGDRIVTRGAPRGAPLVGGLIVTLVAPLTRAGRIASPAGIVGRVPSGNRIVASAVLPGRPRPALP